MPLQSVHSPGPTAICQRAVLDRRQWLHHTTAGALACITAATAAATGQRTTAAAESGWWTWRGPLGRNIAATAEFAPLALSAEHLLWETPVPGRGHSSPIVTDEAIYLTTADPAQGTQSVLAYRRQDGSALWHRVVHQGGLPSHNHQKNTEASPTAAFTGSQLLTLFYNSDALWLSAYTTEGEQLWQRSVGPYQPQTYKFGYGASPAIYKDTAIVVSDYDGDSFMAAVSLSNGEPVWRVERHHQQSYSSPIIAHLHGRDQLLISGGHQIASYDPASGKLLWSASATTMATCGTLVWDQEFIYGSGGYPDAQTACVRADGSGEVVWTNNQQCYSQSMLAAGGYLYAVTDQGIAYCWRGADGEMLWRQRLGGNYSSSPLLVGDRIYVLNEQGEAFCFRATPERYTALGRGRIGDEGFATPAVVANTMYLRTAREESGGRQEYLLALR